MGPPNDPLPFSASALRKMPYLRNVVKESLRLTPTGPGLVRLLDDPIDINGYAVPPKTMIFLNQYSVNKVTLLWSWLSFLSLCILLQPSHPLIYLSRQQDPIQFPNPYELIPERWDKDSDIPKPSPWIHLPFGWGPRMCQGMRVSEMEMYAFISKVIQNYEWVSEGEAEPYLELFIRPEKKLNITWKKV
jgi:cytochrome P450